MPTLHIRLFVSVATDYDEAKALLTYRGNEGYFPTLNVPKQERD